MKKSTILDLLDPGDITCDLIQVGAFGSFRVGEGASRVHNKTCQHMIFAQALQGHYEISCGKDPQTVLETGEAFLTGPNIPLRIVHCGDPSDNLRMRIRYIHLRCLLFTAIDITTLMELPLRVTPEQCEPFGSIIDKLLAEKHTEHQNSLHKMMRQQELAFRFLSQLCELAPLRPDAVRSLYNKDRIMQTVAFMNNNIANNIAVEEVARHVSLSVPRFHAWFRKLTGRAPMEYFKQLRLTEACRLLNNQDMTLQEVAECTGFCNQFHFSRDFSKSFGKPPGQWKREQHEAINNIYSIE